jgi:O-antigen/teichoic acid export membrane protein
MGKFKLLSNSTAVLITRLAQSVTAFALTAAIARILGAYQLGQYLLAFSYYFLFVNVVSQGLKVLLTRELARNPQDTPVCLTNGTLLQFVLSILGYLALIAVVFVLPYSPDTTIICYVMGLSIIPFALSNITEAVLQAQEKMHLIAIACVPIYILRVFVMIWAMQFGYGVNYLAVIMAVSELLILIAEWFFILPNIKLKWKIRPNYIRKIIIDARVFFAIEGIAVFNSRVQIILLSLLGNELMVGVYGAIVQLMQPFLIVANSVAVAVFPAMSKVVAFKEKQRELTESVIEMLLIMALPFFVGLLFFGDPLMNLVYGGRGFDNTGIPLAIAALYIPLIAFYRPLSFLLMANGHEKLNMQEVIVTTMIGSLLGVFLISKCELIGAALMYALMSISSFVQYVTAVQSRLFRLQWWQVSRRSILVSSLMTIIFLVLKQFNVGFIQVLLVSLVSYGVIAGFIFLSILRRSNKLPFKLFAKKL